MSKKLKQHTPEELAIFKVITDAMYNKQPLSGPEGALTKLIKQALELSLEGELDAHMAEQVLDNTDNRKNGKTSKTVKSQFGSFELETPRDRLSSFDPQLVKKRQTVITDEIDTKILSLYALANSYEDISQHISDIYGINVSQAAISAVTDKLLPQIAEWRSRPLDPTYPIIFLDGMYFKVREDGVVKNKVLYNVMGVNCSGNKEILGFYTCDSESSSFWLAVLNDLKARGLQDILIAAVDGLKGFVEAINTAFPLAEVQLCIVHHIRNSLRLVLSKDQKAFMADLKQVYQAPNKDVAFINLEQMLQKWPKYHAALKSWVNNWEVLTTYFKYSPAIRKLVYTTNPIEGFHRQVRKYTKTKAAFVSEPALLKLVFCAILNISRKWFHPIPNWALALSELDSHFPDRLPIR